MLNTEYRVYIAYEFISKVSRCLFYFVQCLISTFETREGQLTSLVWFLIDKQLHVNISYSNL